MHFFNNLIGFGLGLELLSFCVQSTDFCGVNFLNKKYIIYHIYTYILKTIWKTKRKNSWFRSFSNFLADRKIFSTLQVCPSGVYLWFPRGSNFLAKFLAIFLARHQYFIPLFLYHGQTNFTFLAPASGKLERGRFAFKDPDQSWSNTVCFSSRVSVWPVYVFAKLLINSLSRSISSLFAVAKVGPIAFLHPSRQVCKGKKKEPQASRPHQNPRWSSSLVPTTPRRSLCVYRDNFAGVTSCLRGILTLCGKCQLRAVFSRHGHGNSLLPAV